MVFDRQRSLHMAFQPNIAVAAGQAKRAATSTMRRVVEDEQYVGQPRRRRRRRVDGRREIIGGSISYLPEGL
jgi:hypothetical protein